jgi:hypothetical protein
MAKYLTDAYDRSFSDAWLPSWKLLRMSLMNEYKSKTKALEGRAEEKKSKDKLPVAVGGFGTIQCYGCGGPHKKDIHRVLQAHTMFMNVHHLNSN